MPDPREILCGGLASRGAGRRHHSGVSPLRLRTGRGRSDIRLNLEHLTSKTQSSVPDRLTDLLEIAAYVYVADQAVSRGGGAGFDYGNRWRRTMRFTIPVRCPDLWNRRELRGELQDGLGFLSDERYEFHFVPHPDPPPVVGYLTDGLKCDAGAEIEEVVLFSGGLDSLGGAVEEILVGQRKVALVSHRPVGNIYARQRDLVNSIAGLLPRAELRPLHVAVAVNKGKALDREFTQRTRSFLFASVATVAAQQLGRDRIRFYENGVTGLNLPISGELVGSLASRTTHPQTLKRFARFFSLLLEKPFVIQNPFQDRTKAEVLARIRATGHGELCVATSSCVHTRELTDGFTHCGRCTQCVDRRLAALAAGLNRSEDDPELYRSDVICGPRFDEELTLVERYTGFAAEMEGLRTAPEFSARYPEINRAIPYLDLPAAEGSKQIFELYRRHADGLRRALSGLVVDYRDHIVLQSFPPNSLLGVVLGRVEPAGSPTNGIQVLGASRPESNDWTVDRERFEVRRGGSTSFFGNTVEFRMIEYLSKRRNRFVTVAALLEDVWDGADVSKNTVQRTASNIRNKLKKPGFDGLEIDGSQSGCYCFHVPELHAGGIVGS